MEERNVKKILILGAGFGGLETATGLCAGLGEGYEVTLVDRSDSFFVGFSKIDVLFGRRTESEVRYRYEALGAEGLRFVQAEVVAIDTDSKQVTTSAGSFAYDVLVVALGAELDIDATPGFRESGGYEFYSMAGAVRLGPVLSGFDEGTLLLGILGAPYKCPPAPYEVVCQIHELLVSKGVRDRVTLKVVIPSPRPVPNPAVSDGLERMLGERGIELVRERAIRSIDATAKHVVTANGNLSFDLFVGVPVHVPPAVVRSSKLVDKGYITPSPKNLETHLEGVYAIGDVTRIPVGENVVPKAGAFAEDAARTVVSDLLVKEGKAATFVPFEARGACYFEVSRGQVAKVSSNFFGGEKPVMTFDEPRAEFHADKIEFETSRRDRWFRRH